MNQRKARLKAFGEKYAKVEEFYKLYMYSLRALISSLPSEISEVDVPKYASIGRAEIWPCTDGAVVLVYSDSSKEISVSTHIPLSRTINDFLAYGTACSFYDNKGNKSKIQAMIQIGDASRSIIHFADNKIEGSNGEVFTTKYCRASIFGWEAELPVPDEVALKDFRAAYVPRNLAGPAVEDLPEQKKQEITKTKANELLTEYNKLLDEAQREEDLQKFLTIHPEFIYPDYISCHPKFKLGEDYVTDYVLLVQGHNGPEYIFVEIERADKDIFVKSGQFSASFTQAKDQLLDWDNWLTKNHAYVSGKLLDLYKPQFHLVIGRDTDLTKDQKEKIQSEFTATSRRFSTYDDLSNRFRAIVDRLLENT